MEYKTIQIPISEEDIRMFQELVHYGREPFMWTFDNVWLGVAVNNFGSVLVMRGWS